METAIERTWKRPGASCLELTRNGVAPSLPLLSGSRWADSRHMRQKIPVVVLLLSSALLSQPALAQERVIGLLALPEVFGRGACDRFTPRPVELRATPQGPVVGTVLVVKPWTHHSNGGCEGLEVGVRAPRAATVQQLPTMEYAYEEPGAVVLERRGKWFRVRLNSWLGVA